MPSYDSKELPLGCPNQKCKRPMKVRYSEIYSSRRTKCGSCGTEINFNSSATSDFKSALDDMARAEDKLNRAVAGILKNAEIKLKL